MIIRCVPIILFIFALCGKAFAAEFSGSMDAVVAVADAGKAYAAGDYAKAAQAYEGVLARGIVNGALLHNLGAVYYRQERVGEAIAAFRGASRFLPRDAEVLASLEYARKRRVDSIESSRTPFEQFLFWAGWASLGEYVFLTSTLFSIGFTWLLLRKRFSQMAMWPFWGILAVSALLFMTTVAKYCHWVDRPAGVVFATEVSVKSGNADANVTLFVLHAGAEVVVSEKRGEWVQVEIPDGRRGWLRESFLVYVQSPSLLSL
jgi:hypothetical protein